MSAILYPEIEPYETGMLDVGNGHKLYWETSGNPDGMPIVFLHGGPGSGSAPWRRQYYNPDKFRIIQFDQRGAGKSTPHASLNHNTTEHLVGDMDKVRRHLNIDKWHVSGGSWGSTLALAYADKYAEHILSITIYGIFLCRDQELRDLYFDGGIASRIFPDVFEKYLEILPADKRDNPIQGYHDIFISDDKALRDRAVEMWTRLEKRVSALIVPDAQLNAEMSDHDFVLAHSLVENHYFMHHGFINGDNLLKTLRKKLADIPVHIIQGRYDMVTPFKTAWDLHKALPHSELYIIDNAGHTAKEEKTTAKLLEAFDSL